MGDLGEELKWIYEYDGTFTFAIVPGVILTDGKLEVMFIDGPDSPHRTIPFKTTDITLLSGTTEDSAIFLEDVTHAQPKIELRVGFEVEGFTIVDTDYIYDTMEELNIELILFYVVDEFDVESKIPLYSCDIYLGKIIPEHFEDKRIFKISVSMDHSLLLPGG